MKLISISKEKGAADILYRLLAERTPEESISHKEMPSLDDHRTFVRSNPYQCWYLIKVEEDYVGCCYITKERAIGISIFVAHRRLGYGRAAVRMLMEKWPGRFYANINPDNDKSHELFQSMGFTLLQLTFVKERQTWQETVAAHEEET